MSVTNEFPQEPTPALEEIYKSIKEDKCALVLGPNFYDAKGTYRAGLLDMLKEKRIKYRYYGEEELFLFERLGERTRACSQIRDYYNGLPTNEQLYKVVEIPFHTYLTITPDKLLHKAFEELKYPPPQLAYYKKDTEPQQIELPTKENPLVYNAFGILDNKESMVLTHDDLYYYFKSIFKQGKSMPTALKTKLNNVEHIVFLGIPFHKWYMHLLLREFGEHRNEEIVRYAAADYEIPIDLRNFCDLQFKIHFIEDNITEFVDALYHKFEEEEILRVRPKLTDNTKNEVIKVFVGRNRLKRALKRLEDYAKGTKFQNEVIEIKAKFSRYKEKERKNTLTPTDLAVMHAQIVTEIVNLTDLIKG